MRGRGGRREELREVRVKGRGGRREGLREVRMRARGGRVESTFMVFTLETPGLQ